MEITCEGQPENVDKLKGGGKVMVVKVNSNLKTKAGSDIAAHLKGLNEKKAVRVLRQAQVSPTGSTTLKNSAKRDRARILKAKSALSCKRTRRHAGISSAACGKATGGMAATPFV